jgi:hypothetical protein
MRLRLALTLSVALAGLAACQLALPGRIGKAPASQAAALTSPISGDAITTTPLDAPSPAGPATAKGAATSPDKAGASDPITQPAVSEASGEDKAASAKADPAPPPAPAAPKTPAQLACEKRKGVWSSDLSAKVSFCQSPTRDGGKMCQTSGDCEGYCLAKSFTCAPVTPLFGCQDILNENGRMLTQCIN